MSSNASAWNRKYKLLNTIGSKCSLLMKFGQFRQCLKGKILAKVFYKTCGLETSSTNLYIT